MKTSKWDDPDKYSDSSSDLEFIHLVRTRNKLTELASILFENAEFGIDLVAF